MSAGRPKTKSTEFVGKTLK